MFPQASALENLYPFLVLFLPDTQGGFALRRMPPSSRRSPRLAPGPVAWVLGVTLVVKETVGTPGVMKHLTDLSRFKDDAAALAFPAGQRQARNT
jgi:hypothetical protein